MRNLIGIVTYNPDLKRLSDNIHSITEQKSECDLVIYDNGSKNYAEFVDMLEKAGFCSIQYISSNKNDGIAKALHEIMIYAKDHGYSWVLSLDQDSVMNPELIRRYEQTIEENTYDSIGILTCLIKDRNFNDIRNEEQIEKIKELDFCITSGAFTNVNAYFKTQGYPIEFFIDCVDFDLCYSLKEAGYKILRINYIGLLHEVGRAENKKLLGKNINIYNHSKDRVFTYTRNVIWMQRRHQKSISKVSTFCQIWKLFFKVLFFEKEKSAKISSIFKGIRAAKAK